MSGATATSVSLVAFKELENIPFYQLARQWKDDNLQFLVQSPLMAILSLKMYFDRVLDDDWCHQAGDFLLAELGFYFQLSAVRPKNEKWRDLIDSLPRGNSAVWQEWLRRQSLELLEIDEELLKTIYYYFAHFKKKGCRLDSADLLVAYRELSSQGRFSLNDFKPVADYFSKNYQK